MNSFDSRMIWQDGYWAGYKSATQFSSSNHYLSSDSGMLQDYASAIEALIRRFGKGAELMSSRTHLHQIHDILQNRERKIEELQQNLATLQNQCDAQTRVIQSLQSRLDQVANKS